MQNNVRETSSLGELVREWKNDEFHLLVYDTGEVDDNGKAILGYQLFDGEYGDEPMFQGTDFHCSPMHAIDSDRTVVSLLSFFSLQPGDTDREHFDAYSERQLEWCQQRGEELFRLVHELMQRLEQGAESSGAGAGHRALVRQSIRSVTEELASEEHQHLRPRIRDAVEAATSRALEHVMWVLEQGTATTFDEVTDAIRDMDFDDTLAIDLDLDDRLHLVELYETEYDLQLNDVDIDSLRFQIESLANLVLHHLGEDRCETACRKLMEFLEEHDFELDDIVESNRHEWARHYAERSEGDSCQVYEYRNLEGEGLHVDVWEYRVAPGWTVYLERWLEKGSCSPEEETFDAS